MRNRREKGMASRGNMRGENGDRSPSARVDRPGQRRWSHGGCGWTQGRGSVKSDSRREAGSSGGWRSRARGWRREWRQGNGAQTWGPSEDREGRGKEIGRR